MTETQWTYDRLFDECERLKKDNAQLVADLQRIRATIAECARIVNEYKEGREQNGSR